MDRHEAILERRRLENSPALLIKLLDEAFAKESEFDRLTLKEIGEALEESKDYWKSLSEEALQEQVLLCESFQRCHDLYCRLLLELEKEGRVSLFEEPVQSVFERAETVGEVPSPEEYLAFASWLQSQQEEKNLPVPRHLSVRIQGQSVSFALELSVSRALQPGFQNLWPHRQQASRALLEVPVDPPRLCSDLQEGIESLVDKHKVWLYKGTFSYARTLEALRYLTSFPLVGQFAPTLLECGLYLLLFGQDTLLGSFPVRNVMGLEGLEPLELVELAFRLSRAQKIRNKLTRATRELQDSHLSLFHEDFDRISQILRALSFRSIGI